MIKSGEVISLFKKDFGTGIIYGGVFALYCIIIVTATLYYSPWWGVVDDAHCLDVAAKFWKLPSIGSFCGMVKEEMVFGGRFRPIYQFWIISAYSVFRNFPVGVYLFMALAGLATLLVWGRMINEIFPASQDKFFNLFVYPLSFFIFTPFWNNFMYITVLEKFVYFFSSFSLYFYIRAYKTGKAAYLGVSCIFIVLGMFGKETGVALAGVYCAYSLLDMLIFHKNAKLSSISLAGSASIIVGYFFLVRGIWTGPFSLAYKQNFNIGAILNSLFVAPMMIKLPMAVSVIFLCAGIILILRRPNGSIRQEYLLFPFFLGAYLLILSPMGFRNYYLAPIAPSMMLTIYPIYMFIGARSVVRRGAFQIVLIILISLVLIFIIIPRISKMGEIKKVVSAIASIQNKNLTTKFFIGPPFYETACMLQLHTNAGIEYLISGLIDENMLQDKARNYIIFEDRCSSLEFHDVAIEDEVYHNDTWRIFSLTEAAGKSLVFKPVFDRNFMQRIKDWIKTLH